LKELAVNIHLLGRTNLTTMTDIHFLIYIHSLTMAWLYVNIVLQFPIYLLKKSMPFNKTAATHAYTVEVRITDSGL